MQNRSLTLISAFAFLLSVVAAWQIATHWLKQGRELAERTEVIANPADLDAFVAREAEAGVSANFSQGAPIAIPTGVFIQSLVFNSSSDVNLTGYVWQKYPLDFPYQKGVIFPEQIMSDATVMEQEYTETVMHDGEPHELIGWYFDVTVRQSFDYHRYPLDFLTIWLRMWSADFENDHRILLVPDFASYHVLDAGSFGLDVDIVQGEWVIDNSFFSYQAVPYDTTFGYEADGDSETYQEFYFNLGADRTFINAFIINLVPLLVVAVLLFAAVMTNSNDDEQAGLFGSNASGVIGTCSALFFVVLLSHIQVRSMFAGSGLVYIEYFYLVMYGMILITALNAYLFSLTSLRDNWILHYRDNYIAKVSFWPVLLWSMLLITWAVL